VTRLPLAALLLLVHAAPVAAQRLSSIELRWDNDILAPRGGGAPDDFDYTNGFITEAVLTDGPRGYRVTVGQQMYTPRRDSVQPVPGERPYAGWLFVRGTATVPAAGWDREAEVELGVTGPPAAGEPVQKAVHALFGFKPPRGWDHQLPVEVAGAVRLRLIRPMRPSYGELRPYAEVGLGTLWSGGAAGVRFRRPGRTSLEAGLRGEWVARNLFVDGSTWGASVRAERRPWVATAVGGIEHRLGRWSVSYRATVRTPEYRAQPRPHAHGSLGVRVQL
jgi:lipid A 3-O-deacylase